MKVTVSAEDRVILEKWIKSRSVSAKQKQRAKIVLMSADGIPTHELMKHLKVTNPTLNLWRRRYLEGGINALVKRKSGSFTVSGLASLDQIQGVLDSLTQGIEQGGTFAEWQKWALDQPAMGALPPHRLETIYRTAIQTHYNAGRTQELRTKGHPFSFDINPITRHTSPMTRPRSTLISLSDTPWYHVVNRCVRRAFLCGQDAISGRSYEHRRGWIVERIQQLSAVFAVDVAAYAVMSNHYHLVLRVDAERVQGWSQDEVLKRWTQLFEGPYLVRQVLAGQGDELDEASLLRVAEYAETYRQRLADISWFMRILNETIARKANAEDEVKGRFWEGRFKSQALLDQQAVLSAMTYVDLNPIRAQMADTPEDSAFTSIAERLAQLAAPKRQYRRKAQPETPAPAQETPAASSGSPASSAQPNPWGIKLRCERQLAQIAPQPLMPFDATARLKTAIPFSFDDYLELVESTGRCLRPDKRGAINEKTPRLLQRLNIDPEQFLTCANRLMTAFGSAIGAPAHLTQLCVQRQTKFLHGMRAARVVFERKTA